MMIDLIIILLVTYGVLLVTVLLAEVLNKNADKISNFFNKLFGSETSKKSNGIESTPVFDEIKKQAIIDADNGDFQIRYENNLKKQEYYNNCYRTRRKEIVKYDAFHDAEKIFLYNYGELEYKPFLRGAHLTIPAEIVEYQGLFVEEKARLEELAKTEIARIKELKIHLKALYEDDYQNPIDPKEFNKLFQLGEYTESIQNTVQEKSVSAQEIVNKNSRKGVHNLDYAAVRAAHRDANKLISYNNIFKGIKAVDYHIAYYDMRMKIVKKSANDAVEKDIEDYDQFKNHIFYRKEVRRDKSKIIPVYSNFTFDFNEKQYFTKKYRENMKSKINGRDINVEVPVYETVNKESA